MTLAEFRRYSSSLGFTTSAALSLLGLYIVATIFETIGVAMLLPVLQYAERGGDIASLVADSRIWQWLDRGTQFVGIPLSLATLLTISFACIMARQATFYIRIIFVVMLQEDLQRRIRTEGFARYLRAESRYHDEVAAGDIINALSVETRRAVITIMSPVELASYVLMFSVYLLLLFALSAEMTLSALAIMGVTGWFLRGVMSRSHLAGRAVAEANKQMSAFLTQRLRSPRLIRLSGVEAGEIRVMAELTQAQRDRIVGVGRLGAQAGVAVEPIVVAIGFVFLYIAFNTFGLALGTISLFLLVLLRLLPVTRSIIAVRQSMLANMGSLEMVDQRLRQMANAQEINDGHMAIDKLRQGIAFENVSFSYREGAPPALDGLSLRISAKSVVALVGPTGSGKSTLIDMLPRLREPDGGRITLDGHSLDKFERTSLRSAIAYAPQAPEILNVTVSDHIRFGKPDATEAEIWRAADLADASEFIVRLPEGLATLLGEDGARLSGGQRQRLDLARALVAQSPILILDEPTSNLDAATEERFKQTLARIRRETETTIIIVGHRLSTVSTADQIVVLLDGRVHESGNHRSLLKLDGWYADAYKKQTHDATLAAE